MFIKRFFITTILFVFASTFCFSDDVSSIIDLLEQKKQVFVSQKMGNPNMEAQIREEAREEYQRALENIDDEELRIAQTDAQGRILSEVQDYKIEEKRNLKQKIDAKTKKEIESLKNKDTPYDKELLQEIENLEKSLVTERIISSNEDSKIFSVSSYAGDKYYWNTQISFFIQGKEVFTKSVPLEYKNVSGKAPVSIKKADTKTYNDYLDTVDYYDELLKQQNGPINLQISYTVQPMDMSQPSTYEITIKKIRFVNEKTKSVIQNVDVPNNPIIYKVNPPVDMRINSNQNKNKTLSYQTEQAQNYVAQNDNQTYDRRGNKTNSNDVPAKKSNSFKSKEGRFLFGGNFSTALDFYDYEEDFESVSVGLFTTVPLNSYVYMIFDFNFMPNPFNTTNVRGYYDILFDLSCGIGVNYQFKNNYFKPNVYFAASFGSAFSDSDFVDEYGEPINNSLFFTKFTSGFDYPISKNWIMGGEFSFTCYSHDIISTKASINIAIDLN